jgi:hypothetical protein|tara:strand:- start:712 stop:819 length:108 start_codon:yes stop_codon:yes gene_type:complete
MASVWAKGKNVKTIITQFEIDSSERFTPSKKYYIN